jgi:hypothetical protein
MNNTKAAAIAILAAVISGIPKAQAEAGPRARADTFTAPSVGRSYLSAGFAAFAPVNDGQLQGERNSYTNTILGGGYRFSSGLALEVELKPETTVCQ